jgi:hypothetical protein
MLAMKTGVLVCSIFAAVCFAGQPVGFAQVAANSGPAYSFQHIARPSGPALHFGSRLDQRNDTTRDHAGPLRHAAFPNPFLDRFRTGASMTAAGHDQWPNSLYLHNALRGDSRSRPNPALEPDVYFPYDSREMKTLSEVAGWVVPLLLPTYGREVLLPERFDPEPGRHGWPYRRW